MALLSQLPNELILMIVRHVLPADLEAVSVLSWHIHTVSSPVLEQYHERKKRYTSVSNLILCNEDGDSGTPAGVLAELLSEVLINSMVGHHIKKLEVGFWFRRFTGSGEFFIPLDIMPNPHVPYPESQMTAFRAAMPHALMGKHHETDFFRWMCALDLGDEDALIALLLLQCPNLETLTLGQGDKHADCVKTVLSLAAINDTPEMILPRLKRVELYLDSTDLMDYIRLFMILPSLTSLSVWNIQKSNLESLSGDITVPTLQPGISNVRELKLHGDFMNHEILYEILQACSNLTSLSYDVHSFWLHRRAKEPPCQLYLRSVMSALSSSNQCTLQSLFLRTSRHRPGKPSERGIREMPRTIEHDAEWTLALVQTGTTVLVDRLRLKLRYMVLHYRSINATEYYREKIFEPDCKKPSNLLSHGESHVWETTDDRGEDLADGFDELLCRKGLARLGAYDPDYYAISTREVR